MEEKFLAIVHGCFYLLLDDVTLVYNKSRLFTGYIF